MSVAPLRTLVTGFAALLEDPPPEPTLLVRGAALLRDLVRHDDWLPAAFARPNPLRHSQHLLHCDSRERFCVVSFVWGPGQETPIHDHTVWGLIGVLRGGEMTQSYERQGGAVEASGEPRFLGPGEVEALSPRLGDIHRVWNASQARASVSIHVYGGNIAALCRTRYTPDGSATPFLTPYDNAELPNIWADAGTGA